MLGSGGAGGRLVIDRADELRRIGEGRVVGVDFGHRQQRCQGLVLGEEIAQLLLDQIADHPVGLRPEQVERVGRHTRQSRRLQRKQPDLGAVAVGDDELVIAGQRSEGEGGGVDVRALVLGRRRLAPTQQGIAAEGDDDPHSGASLSLPARVTLRRHTARDSRPNR
jgi:hypothetical protein